MKRYATAKQVEKLTEAVLELAKKILQLERWQVYRTIKENPYVVSQNIRNEILAQTETDDKLLYFLFKNMFAQNPPISFTVNEAKT